MRAPKTSQNRRFGFTLLELVLAIGLLAMLAGMIFAVASQNIALGRTVVDKQNEESVDTALFELLDTMFAALPGNARLELLVESGGSDLLSSISSDMTIQNVPLGFTWGGVERIAQSIQLSTVRRRDGFYDIVLRYYEGEILEETQRVGDSAQVGEEEPFAEVVLLEDVTVFAWQVLDGRSMDEWQPDWEIAGRLPLQLELTYMRDPTSEVIRHVFWIVPKQNPEVLMRQMTQQGAIPTSPGAATPTTPTDGNPQGSVPAIQPGQGGGSGRQPRGGGR
ncbi:prepilin-type N-terminal cleavage/methylation domain-containing protein [Haloferula sp.]|uniref:prepilin-type N-terminal cleavage/methylation domain-containing protein n=1 Tax=Haloferula sp. TaxID=2497595 RepID=UPI00329E31D5